MAMIAQVHESEAEDFVRELRRSRRSLDEFDITTTPAEPLTKEAHIISPIVQTITITCKQTGAGRRYRAGFAVPRE